MVGGREKSFWQVSHIRLPYTLLSCHFDPLPLPNLLLCYLPLLPAQFAAFFLFPVLSATVLPAFSPASCVPHTQAAYATSGTKSPGWPPLLQSMYTLAHAYQKIKNKVAGE